MSLSTSTSGSARAINDAGQVAGTLDGQAVIFSNGSTTYLGALGINGSEALAVNNGGQVVGVSDDISGHLHAFLYTSGQMIDLTPSEQAFAFAWGINNLGQVVGTFGLYSNGKTIDLNDVIDPSLHLSLEPRGINGLGQIVANAPTGSCARDGCDSRAYLLTPVPEPGTWAFCSLTALIMLTCSFRWRGCRIAPDSRQS